MRACCNKKEDNFITYHSTREKIINDVREWEKLNPEKRKEYTVKYYKTEKGHRKRLAQQKRYREKKKIIKENEKLKNDKMELLEKIDELQQENQELKDNSVWWHNRFNAVSRQNQQYKSVSDEIREYVIKHRQIYDIDGSIDKQIDEFDILASPKRILQILDKVKQ